MIYTRITNEKITTAREQLRVIAEDRERRIRECLVEELDCFRSIEAERIHVDVLNAQEALNAADGQWTFLVVTDLAGRQVDAFEAQGQWGWRWCVEGQWMPQYGTRDTARRLANLADRGYRWTEVTLPAVVATEAVGHQVRVTYLPADRKPRRIIRAA